jgi:hypothetical protein
MTILETIRDAHLFAPWFRGAFWHAWEACLAAIFGLPMSEAMRGTFTHRTGRQTPPEAPARGAWLVVEGAEGATEAAGRPSIGGPAQAVERSIRPKSTPPPRQMAPDNFFTTPGSKIGHTRNPGLAWRRRCQTDASVVEEIL